MYANKEKMILATEAPVIKKKKGSARRRLLRKITIPKNPEKFELETFPKKAELGLRNKRLKSVQVVA